MGVYIKVIPYSKNTFKRYVEFKNILDLLESGMLSKEALSYNVSNMIEFVDSYENQEEIQVEGFNMFFGVGWANLTVSFWPLFSEWKFCPEEQPWSPYEIETDLIPKYELFTCQGIDRSAANILDFMKSLVKNNYILMPE